MTGFEQGPGGQSGNRIICLMQYLAFAFCGSAIAGTYHRRDRRTLNRFRRSLAYRCLHVMFGQTWSMDAR
jgi:hypothetical protein